MNETLHITILGCGSSGGVPRVGGEWGVCDPNESKNRRTRSSILVEKRQGGEGEKPTPDQTTAVLIDTSPDLREQLIAAGTQRLDAIFFTHDHADQTHGIDDVRAIAYRMRKRIPTYMDSYTKTHVFERFKYCFEMPDGRVHPPILDLISVFKDNDTITVDGPGGRIKVNVLAVSHGPTPSNGFLFDDRAVYSPDVWDIPDAVFERIHGADLWILDALRYNEHPTHAHTDRTLQWLARAAIRQGVLTNLHIDMDYQTLSDELPGQHKVAYDGFSLSL
ncbi:MAG: MBL fold metallo-hydrolase [Hyphomonadaceae bacterium]|nr:MBL fold metallo-hydrolase [Hyphomonadaceae bacterium]MBC6412144.1 MBL fold metallo-hydrolase [Hyphomonadaceae bacterium]